MKILFLGDSITSGVGASSYTNKYVERVKQKIECQTINYGVSGTRIARQKIFDYTRGENDWDFQQRMGAMDKDADMVFVFGGTNDFGHGNAEIGKKGDTDPYTFYGGMENLTNYLLSTYGKEKVCFLLPLRRAVEERADGRTLLDYVEVIKEVLIEKGIDYLDFYDNGLPKPISTQPDEYFADGLHPNDAGHDWVAEQVANYLKNK